MNFGETLFQTKLLSLLSHKVCPLLSSPVLLRKFTTDKGGGLPKILYAFQALVWSKNKGGGRGPPGPSPASATVDCPPNKVTVVERWPLVAVGPSSADYQSLTIPKCSTLTGS